MRADLLGLMHGVVTSLSVNGGNKCDIKIQRGVKQGCPLSPLLYNLCADVLIYLLKDINNCETFVFADDTALFF